MGEYFTIKWLDGTVRMLDQRLLPAEIVYRDFIDARGVALAIRDMIIRGAPAIGAAGGFGMALAALHSRATDKKAYLRELDEAARLLIASRPTAINLSWAIERVMKAVSECDGGVSEITENVLREAQAIAEEDVRINLQMAQNGLALIPDGANIIHHCNTGALATVGYGTALGVIRAAHESGKRIHVFVDETRPRLQGARLTSWELKQSGIPHTVIVDGAAAHIMRTKRVDLCLVGCDRIAANGDVANKIGTYHLALAAYMHKIKFYSVGPTSTIDLKTSSGDDIPIEERSRDEVAFVGDNQITPSGVQITNPAFDVTPAKYITAIVTERGIAYPPYRKNLAKIMAG